ncbi:hypothetical protein [Achromobacter piechaudii]|uniref:Uncharacterized protein n=1 Tax=Achromobacter piechaudii ATCC 43553 TaxID=742159 RepID=D4XGU2_9BURK|nr:hypothetical protein [Achromobacter piechaudii]EFF73981.1 hypothetical protein HMPREF0004_4689 [Achromobacter piechaudii ATCC 43553]
MSKIALICKKVWLYLHDEGPVSVKLADSFEEFIAGLSVDPDNI